MIVKPQDVYLRLVRMNDKGELLTLFHGTKGSRVLHLNKWLQADIKEVHDGTNGTPYLSGFHLLCSIQDMAKVIRTFKKFDNLYVIPVFADGIIWEKEHSKSNVVLATNICITDEACHAMLPAKYILDNYPWDAETLVLDSEEKCRAIVLESLLLPNTAPSFFHS
jgi:hypothetical protein